MENRQWAIGWLKYTYTWSEEKAVHAVDWSIEHGHIWWGNGEVNIPALHEVIDDIISDWYYTKGYFEESQHALACVAMSESKESPDWTDISYRGEIVARVKHRDHAALFRMMLAGREI